MAFSKFEPHRPPSRDDGMEPSARRRVRLLQLMRWVVSAYTALGFGFIAYWLMAK